MPPVIVLTVVSGRGSGGRESARPRGDREQLVAVRRHGGPSTRKLQVTGPREGDCLNAAAGDRSEVGEVTRTLVGGRPGQKVDRISPGGSTA